jgi:hypothetical protein
MNKWSVLAASMSAGGLAAAAYGAAPAKKAPAAVSAQPVASYWMDVATQSGLGAGMTGGGARPNIGQIMAMMNGGGGVMHMLDLRLASKDRPAGAPQADHLVPPGLQMGASLPLLTPVRAETPRATSDAMPTQMPRPKGRLLIYWGCGEHVGPGQPTVIDFSKLAAGQVPPGMAAMASIAHAQQAPSSAPGFGRWPNERDSRQVPATGSLIGAHKVQANYAPPIAFSLGAGQDFMPGLGLREAGAAAGGGTRLMWQPVPTATGYALAMFGADASGDVVMWSSANKAQMASLDYLAPAEVRRLIAAGAVVPPTTSQCVLPAEVSAAAPQGMLTMIGYGPEVDFSDNPKTPKWVTKVRFKTTATLMHGIGGDGQAATQPQQHPAQKRRFGLGEILGGALPIPH